MNNGAPVDTLRPITYLGIIPFVPRNLARCISRVPFLSYPSYSWQSLAIIVETCISLPNRSESNDKIRETKLLKSRFKIYLFSLYFCAFLLVLYINFTCSKINQSVMYETNYGIISLYENNVTKEG